MEAFVLKAVLGLDKSDYDKGLDDAKNQAASDGGGLGKALSNAAKVGTAALTAAATAAVALGGTAVKAGMDFDASMSNVAAISGAQGKDFDDLRAKAQEMGASTKFSATEAADAFSYMAMAGWKTNDMLGGIEGIMNLAAASGEDLATTSDIVTDALTAFGMSADQSGHFADILAVASSNANTNVSMMGETFKYLAPVAGSLGYSAEDMAEAIGLIANSGIKSSQAGTSLRSIIARLSTDAGASSKSLGALGILTEKLGVQFYNADGSARDFNDVIVEARAAWAGLTDEQQTNYANQIAGQEGLSAWMALMNASSEDVDKLHNSIVECDGAAAKMAKTAEDNLAGDITIFKSALEGAHIAISDELTPSLRDFVQFGTNGLGELTKAFQADGLDGAMAKLGELLSEGIGLVVGKLPEMVDAGMQLLGALGQGLIDNLPQIAGAAIQIVTSLAQYIAEGIPQLMTSATDIIVELATMLSDPGTLSGLLSSAGAIVQGIVSGIAQALPTLTTAGIGVIQNLIQGISENLPQLIQSGAEMLSQIVQGLTDSISMILTVAPEVISQLLTAIVDNAPTLLTSGVEIINQLVQGISDNLATFMQAAPQIMNELLTALTEAAPTLLASGVEIITTLAQGVTDNLPGMLDTGIEIMGSLLDAILGNLPEIIGAASEIISTLATGIMDSLPTLIEKAPEIIATIVTTLAEHLPEILTAGANLVLELVGGILSGLPNIIDAIGQVGGKIIEGLKDLPDQALQWGKDMLDSFVDGIKDKLDVVGNAARSVAQKIRDFLGFSEPTEGPLSEFHTFAPDMMQLFADGITENAGIIETAIRDNFDIASIFNSIDMSSIGETLAEKITDGLKDIGTALSETIQISLDESLPGVQEAGQRISEGLKWAFIDHSNTAMADAGEFSILALVQALQAGGPSMNATGTDLVKFLSTGISDKKSVAVKAIKEVIKNIDTAMRELKTLSEGWGKDMMSNFARGIKAGLKEVKSAVNEATSHVKKNLHFSKPDEGPLSDFDTYAPDMMALFASGIRENEDLVADAIDGAFDFGHRMMEMAPQTSGWGGGGREVAAPRSDSGKDITIIVKLSDDTEVARAVYRMYNEEERRVGRKLAEGM